MSRAVLAVAVAACLAACQRAPLPARSAGGGGGPAGGASGGGSSVDLGGPGPGGGDDLAMSLPPPDPCGALACTLGASCAVADGCCGCGITNQGCITLGWVCAHPASNDPRCPASEPALGTACALPPSIVCWYCGSGNLPDGVACGGLAGSPDCASSGDSVCWTRTVVFGKCS
jgi:hypothetical protein